jgi:hypothetical protein
LLSFIKERLFPPERPAGTPVGESEVGRSFSKPEGKQLRTSPTARLSAGESYTFRRIIILQSRLNRHSGFCSLENETEESKVIIMKIFNTSVAKTLFFR